eukprot:tig00000767_g3968.t1
MAFFGWYTAVLTDEEVLGAANGVLPTDRPRLVDYRMDTADCAEECGAGTLCDRVGEWQFVWLEFGAPDSAGLSPLKAYLNGALITSTSIKAIENITRTANYIGKPNEWGRPFASGVLLAEFWIWSGTWTAQEVVMQSINKGPPRTSVLLHLQFDDCAKSGRDTRRALDGSGNGLHALVNDDAYFTCPENANATSIPAPTILAADVTSPTSAAVTVAWSTGEFISLVEVRCGGFGGPYRSARAVEDADAEGATLELDLVPSFEGPYELVCTALVSTLAGDFSPPSANATIDVPPGGSLPAQSALLPAGNSKALNVYERPLFGMPPMDAAAPDRDLVYAAVLPGYPLGSRGASARLALVFRVGSDLLYCDYDLGTSTCAVLQRYPVPFRFHLFHRQLFVRILTCSIAAGA